MAEIQIFVCLLIVVLACVEAHFFGNLDDDLKALECSDTKVRTCKGALIARQAALCAKPPSFYKDGCDQTTIADTCCNGAGCSDCFLISCC
uniref:Uncharacterized protein n=1 Tax=Panagrolaimus sp. ES5 TaxID=591445 RepID=A0AC34F881_9BILA